MSVYSESIKAANVAVLQFEDVVNKIATSNTTLSIITVLFHSFISGCSTCLVCFCSLITFQQLTMLICPQLLNNVINAWTSVQYLPSSSRLALSCGESTDTRATRLVITIIIHAIRYGSPIVIVNIVGAVDKWHRSSLHGALHRSDWLLSSLG